MRFYIHTGNHYNSGGIADTVMFLKYALEDCGHDPYITSAVVPGEVNIVLEHFIEEEKLRELIDARPKGARFVLIGTEPIVGGSFNAGVASTDKHYGNVDYWKTRFEGFRVAADFADVIWVLAEDMVTGYQALLPGKPVHFLPHGYVNHFATVRQRPEAQRDVDFYFSGSMTDHRTDILRTLARHHTIRINTPGAADYMRLEMLSRAKVCLSMRLSPANAIPSVSRIHFHLQNKSFLIHEAYERPCPLDPYLMHIPPAEFVDWAVAALAVPNRRDIAEAAHQRFKADLPMTELLPPLLQEVLRPVRSSAVATLPARLLEPAPVALG
jgi:hypothetical protein